MKALLFSATMFVAAGSAMAADVGVSVNIGQPGFFGQIDIGRVPRPAVIYSQPVIVERHTQYVGEPVYLRVPPGHQKKWSKHCGEYNACGQKVYFVQDNWYNQVYVPQYRHEHDDRDHRDHNDHNDDHERDGRDNHDKHHDDHDRGHDHH